MRCFNTTVLWLAIGLQPVAQATHLGAIGPVYPIGEANALTTIMNSLRAKERSGELKRWQDAAVRRSVHHITHLKPVPGLATVTQRAQRLIDPTVTYTKAVTTDEGHTIVPAGARINPLESMTLSKRLVFFDGRDASQREAVRRLVQQQGIRVKPILVAGSWLALTRAWKTQVYYDQQGTLSQRFGLRAVPSVIRQQGKYLVVEEVPAKENGMNVSHSP